MIRPRSSGTASQRRGIAPRLVKRTLMTAISLTVAAAADGQTASPVRADDALVLAGVGHVGSWRTEAEVVNPNDGSLVIETKAFLGGLFYNDSPCPDPCSWRDDAVSRFGSISLEVALDKALVSGFSTIYITPKPHSGLLPVLHVHLINDANSAQSVSVPVVALSTLTRLDPAVLTFPGARRHGLAHSNLLIANVVRLDSTVPRLSARVTAYSPDGTLLGSLETGEIQDPFIYIVDILGRLGVDDLTLGSIRVTRLGGTGLLWGIMYSVDESGSVTAAVGLNPDSALPQAVP